MKIREVKLIELHGHRDAGGVFPVERMVRPIDIYPEFRDAPAEFCKPPPAGPVPISKIYVEIHADSHVGIYGPICREQAFLIRSRLGGFLVGRDAGAIETLWDQMVRLDRHGRCGYMMMAISAVDCALWDLKGKALGRPVYRLLSEAPRQKLPAYASMLGQSLQADALASKADETRRAGFAAQKWFFRYGPASGQEGERQNLQMVRTLRQTLGDGYQLMFDAWMGWDVDYAIQMAGGMMPFDPTWLEEPLRPSDLKGFASLKKATGIPLAAGEHLYARWEVEPFCRAGLIDYVQADPDWTGGITELMKICTLAKDYGLKVVPHGHNLAAAAHVVAAQPAALCPMVEYLLLHAQPQQFFHARGLFAVDGQITLDDSPGLGIEIDPSRVENRRELFALDNKK